jgi:hypothetical protein
MKLRSLLVLALALVCAPAWAQVNPGTGPLSIAKGGTNRATPFTSNLPLIGNGSGALAQGTRSGNTTSFATTSGALTSGDCVKIDANGNLADNGAGCGANSNTPHTQDFLAVTNFTAGTTTSLTLSSAPTSTDLLIIAFDGVWQNANTWSLAGAVVTFNAAIPLNTQVVEAKWSTSSTLAGVGSITANAVPLTGAVTLASGTIGPDITAVGSTITFTTKALNVICGLVPSACTAALGYTNIMWYGAKCDGVYASNQNAAYTATNLSITSGTPNLLSSGSTFTSADVGKSIWVPGAGAAGVGLSTTIAAFVDATHVTLGANASTTVTAVAATQANPFVYGTDDTTNIQAAMTATPTGGTLLIPGSTTGCLIKKQGANAYALLQDHPFNIRGQGHFSNLMTDPSIASTVDNLLVQTGSFGDWANIVWENFSIGDSASFFPPSLLMYTRHGKRGLALVDSATIAFAGIIVRNMSIGESGNDYSLYLGNATGLGGAQFNIIGPLNKIWGGVRFEGVADSNRIFMNTLQGSSTFGGLFSHIAGAGKFEFSSNNVTWAGGFKLESGFKPSVIHNYFEELYATSESNNALVDFNGGAGTISLPLFWDNIVSAAVSSTSTPVRYSNSTGGIFGGNSLSTSTSRTLVTSTITLNCTAPNNWIGGGTHFSTALANTYAGC